MRLGPSQPPSVAPHVTFTVLCGNPQSCSRFVSRVACTSQLPLAGFVSRYPSVIPKKPGNAGSTWQMNAECVVLGVLVAVVVTVVDVVAVVVIDVVVVAVDVDVGVVVVVAVVVVGVVCRVAGVVVVVVVVVLVVASSLVVLVVVVVVVVVVLVLVVAFLHAPSRPQAG